MRRFYISLAIWALERAVSGRAYILFFVHYSNARADLLKLRRLLENMPS
jgi:hypothetical protein